MAVVSDVKVQVAVIVQVTEQSSQTPLLTQQSGGLRHFAEGRPLLTGRGSKIEVQSVWQTVIVLGESAAGLGDFMIQVDIGGHKKVRPAIPIEIADDRRAVPFRRSDSGGDPTLDKGAIPLIPK